MIKDLIVNLPVDTLREDVVTAFAVDFARTINAHVAGIAFEYQLILPMMDRYGLPAKVVEELLVRNRKAAEAALGKFEEAARRQGISAESRLLGLLFNDASTMFGRAARQFDLSILAQPEPDALGPERFIFEAALFDSGRPVLVVPCRHRGGMKWDRSLVCWDGSRPAARAVNDALPFLKSAKAVEVAVVTGKGGTADEQGSEVIVRHLRRHGVPAALRQIVTHEVDAANMLLSHAADFSADFIVMGGYGHLRLRELVLGGVTRAMLAEMSVPTLMSH